MIWRGALVGVATLAMVLGLIPAAAHAAEPAAPVPAEPLTASSSVGMSIPEVAALAVDAAAAVEMAVQPASLAGFNPANLIDDAVFYDGNAMTAAQIQTFLDQRIGNCSNGRCLNVSQASISSRAALVSQATGNVVCNAIAGGTMRVSELIYRVQRACGISAKVILVTLEKEQGLTTSRAPSDWNLRAAMGAYCPDSAPCDPAFAGVGPQIVAGVTQLKMYRAGAFARQPGTHFIQYHPNQSCGGTNVNVQNYATAALYNYTPYQPNPASLAAVSGTGDGCSSYGNRNFYRFFTSWFGSVRGTRDAELVAVGWDVYVTSGSTRYHIMPSVLSEYQTIFGTPRAVSASHIQNLTDGGRASLIVSNIATGQISMLEGGQTHYFSTCTLVAVWGGECGQATALEARDYNAIRRGGDMTLFARKTAGGQIHRIEGDEVRPVYDEQSAAMLNGGRVPFAAVMPGYVAGKFSTGITRFARGQFIEAGGRTYLPMVDGRLVYLPSWSMAAEYGLPTSAYRRVNDQSLVGYSPSGSLTSFVRCASAVHYAADGRLYRVAGGSEAGFPVVNLDWDACVSVRIDESPASSVFVAAKGSFDVLMPVNGVYRHVTSPSLLQRLNGGSAARVLAVAPSTAQGFARGEALVSEIQLASRAEFVETTSPFRTYLPTSDRRLLYLASWNVAAELGLPQSVSMRVATAATAPYQMDGTLSQWVSCRGGIYLGAGGALHRVTEQAAAGFPVSRLDDATCDRLNVAGTTALSTVLVAVPGDARVYVATGGTFRHAVSRDVLERLTGTRSPTVLPVSASTFASYTIGPPLNQ